MNREEALKAMLSGHKVANVNFTPDEYLHMVNGIVMSEDGYDFRDWFFITKPGEEWKHNDWSIVQICYECGNRIYKGEGSSLDDLNYAHHSCLKG